MVSFAEAAAKAAAAPQAQPSIDSTQPPQSALAEDSSVKSGSQQQQQSQSQQESSSAALPPATQQADGQAEAGPSTLPAAAASEDYRIKHLVLDASPLLTQAPVQALRAQTIYIPPQVVAELRDPKAREHLNWLKLQGANIVVQEGSAEAMLKVIAFAKKTGDYSVLSHPDLSVLALTYALEVAEHGTWRLRDEVGGRTGQQRHEAEKVEQLRREGKLPPAREQKSRGRKANTKGKQRADAESEAGQSELASSETKAEEPSADAAPAAADATDAAHAPAAEAQPVAAAPPASHADTAPPESSRAASSVAASDAAHDDEEDDEEDDEDAGEWITSDNLEEHRNLALGIVTKESKLSKDEAKRLVEGHAAGGASESAPAAATSEAGAGSSAAFFAGAPSAAAKGKGKAAKPAKPMSVACITSDYAVQNVMLQMGLSLISMSGQRITQVKSWVLRCHACAKICKDQEKKFCPSCGNPTLLRTSVTSVAPGAAAKAKGSAAPGSAASLGLQVHLKQNFQYKNRGTIYPLPAPKPSSSSALKQQPAKGVPKRQAVPILREDQAEWQRAVAHERVRKEKQERAMIKAMEKSGGTKDAFSARFDDPDWMPDMLLTSGKGRRGAAGLPALGIGRKNPNERRGPRR